MAAKQVTQLLRSEQSWHNCLKMSKGKSESLEHRNVKYMIVCFCLDNNLDFWTEATFKNGGRADIIISEWGLAIEVLHTEEYKSFLEKSYPLPAIPISTKSNVFDIKAVLEDLHTTNGRGWEYYYRMAVHKAKNLISKEQKE